MSVQCGDNHTICFGGSGELWVFGGNEKGQLGLGHNQVVENPIVNEKLVNIHSVSCGDRFSVCVDGSGDVWVFGSNIMGNLGFPDTSKSFFEPTKCPILKDIRYVSCGSRHTACVDSSGFVWTFGLNNYGQLGLGDRTNRCEPTQVEILSGINSVACGAYHSIFLSSSGKAFSCGRNSFGQLMLGTTTRVTVATPVPPLHAPVAQVACGADHTMFLLEDDTVYGAGCNQKGQLGCLFAAERKVPTKVKDLCGIIRLSCGYNQTMCINTEEELILLGSGEYERTSVMRQNAKNVMKMEERIYALSYGGFHTIFKGVTGKTWAFGRNDCGQLGLGRPSHTDPNYIPSPRLLSESLMEALWEKQTTAKSARK